MDFVFEYDKICDFVALSIDRVNDSSRDNIALIDSFAIFIFEGEAFEDMVFIDKVFIVDNNFVLIFIDRKRDGNDAHEFFSGPAFHIGVNHGSFLLSSLGVLYQNLLGK